RDSKHIIVKVQDEGIGIPSENLKHILDPFFTTKRDSGGTGLGLSVSYSIVKNHSGDLNFTSESGKGTTAIIRLPVNP
ncbi:histidine kinase, partial [candidate division KSB1 bacterium]